MTFLRSALAGLLALLTATAAVAQTFPTVPARSVIGRIGVIGDTGPSQAIPFATLVATLGAAPSTRTISTTAPLAGGGDLSANRTLSITGVAGRVLAGAGPAFTATPTLGASGTLGTLAFGNATSGTVTLQPATGALGSAIASLPAGTYALVGDTLTQALTNKTFDCANNTCTVRIASDVTGLGTGIATWLATPSSANLRAALTDESGTGAAYFQGGDLGTPSAGVLTSATGLPIATGVSGLGAGVATFLATPSSANLATAVTGKTGSGALVFGTSPTLTTPNIGAATGTSLTLSPGADSSTLVTLNGASGNARLIFSTDASGNVLARTANSLDLRLGVNTTTWLTLDNSGTFSFAGSSSGSTGVKAAVAASGTLTLPAATDTLMGKATTDVLTNKTLNSTGTGNVLQVSGVTVSAGQYPGEPTTGSATAGNVGELISATVSLGSPVSLTTGTSANVTSISLTAGDWDVTLACGWTGAATTTVTALNCSASTTTGTLDATNGQACAQGYSGFALFNNSNPTVSCGPGQFSLSSTTTVFFVARANFAVSTASAFGLIRARRVR